MNGQHQTVGRGQQNTAEANLVILTRSIEMFVISEAGAYSLDAVHKRQSV